MADAKTIEEDTRLIFNSKYSIVDTNSIPKTEDIRYWGEAKKFKASVMSIDIRNSSALLLQEGDFKSGKIHKAFLRVCSATINYFDGDIRSFNGDGLMAFWPANQKAELTQVVRAAMGIKWLITHKMKDQFVDKYKLDFGIGLSWGIVTSMRVGIEKVVGANDLAFIDRSINQSVVISKQAKSPGHIECTTDFYGNLLDEAKFDGDKKNMWADGVVRWKHGDFKSRLTTYHWGF
jgi:hypothetical protein